MASLFFAYNEIIPIHTFPKGGLAWIFAPGKAMKICKRTNKGLGKGGTRYTCGIRVHGAMANCWDLGIQRGRHPDPKSAGNSPWGGGEQDNLLLLADIPAHQEAPYHPAVPLSGGRRLVRTQPWQRQAGSAMASSALRPTVSSIPEPARLYSAGNGRESRWKRARRLIGPLIRCQSKPCRRPVEGGGLSR